MQKVLTSEEYFTMKKDYEAAIAKLSDEISTLENGLAVMDAQLAKYKELEQDAKVLPLSSSTVQRRQAPNVESSEW